MNQATLTGTLLVFITALVVGSAIYLTPLKWITIIEPTIDDISAEEFYALYEGNEDNYIFLDVRNGQSYERGHAEGSLNLPVHELYNERFNLPKTDKEIILICSGGVASGVGYSYLEHYGFFNIKRIEGGIEAWSDAGLPMVGSL